MRRAVLVSVDIVDTVIPRRTDRQVVRTRLLLLVGCGGALFGLFGMHSYSQGLAASAPILSHAALNDPPDIDSGHGSHDAGPTSCAERCGMLAMCLLAIGTGAAVLWLIFTARCQHPITELKRVATVGRLFIQTVFRPPPDLIGLSILRC